MKKERPRSSDRRTTSTARRKAAHESAKSTSRKGTPAPRRARVAADSTTRRRKPAGAAPARPDPETREQSPTAVAAEALRKGILPITRVRPAIPHEDEAIRVGDPDDDSMQNEYSGEDTPGGSTPTPDQSNIDDIGRIYGLQEEDSGALQAGGEILRRRDRHRPELKAPSKPRT
jgi:hypothetical protein